MGKILQEKFEVREPLKPEGVEAGRWQWAGSARVKKGMGTEAHSGVKSGASSTTINYNTLPPGMDIEDQEVSDIRVQPEYMSGETDPSRDWNREAVKNGFTRRAMSPTDDLYSREHNDAFYDEVTVDGNTGFLERNNMLDRM